MHDAHGPDSKATLFASTQTRAAGLDSRRRRGASASPETDATSRCTSASAAQHALPNCKEPHHPRHRTRAPHLAQHASTCLRIPGKRRGRFTRARERERDRVLTRTTGGEQRGARSAQRAGRRSPACLSLPLPWRRCGSPGPGNLRCFGDDVASARGSGCAVRCGGRV
ncbi:hypothetical protein PYCCODRAFT_182401 [Trametes coccinea BRFM310]|uniref:Uncharacterized protein n=1 Tax=Trametes coccinea (strain BRFM310) TaxID=1353009 RepID=A0A1Y2I752_TRAC3|nr:hypothetical protein PYCCODRAFT_182401 [Trametes coccinea BRFM310]